jgi:hypothetical protein
MNMNRRSFLGGFLTLSVAAVVGIPVEAAPVIVGDGIHDDWAGLQAMLDGKPFRVDGNCYVAHDGIIGGKLRFTKTLTFPEGSWSFKDVHFVFDPKEIGTTALQMESEKSPMPYIDSLTILNSEYDRHPGAIT